MIRKLRVSRDIATHVERRCFLDGKRGTGKWFQQWKSIIKCWIKGWKRQWLVLETKEKVWRLTIEGMSRGTIWSPNYLETCKRDIQKDYLDTWKYLKYLKYYFAYLQKRYSKRSYKRVTPKDFFDYLVTLKLAQEFLERWQVPWKKRSLATKRKRFSQRASIFFW